MNLHLTLRTTTLSLLLLAACTPGKGETEGESSTGTTGAGTGETGTTDDVVTGIGTATGDSPTTTTGEPGTSTTTTGDPSGTETGQTSDTAGGCVENETPLGLDEASPLGFSAAEALTGQQGPRPGTLTWSPDGFLADGLKGVEWPITLGIAYMDGPIVYVDSTPGMGGGEDGPEPIDCNSRVEISVRVTLDSAAGELSEGRDMIVVATMVGTLELPNQDLLPPGFMGTLTPEQVIEAPMTLDALDVFATLTPLDGSGGFNGEVSDPMLGSVGYGTLASFVLGAPDL